VRSIPALAAAALLLAPAAGLAATPAADAPLGLVVTGSVAGGGEFGLSQGKSGVVELEGTVGYELALGLRPEFGLAVGFEPDTNLAVRPGLRWSVPALPLQLRMALDASNSRGGWKWRWFMLGAATELRFTSVFGLFVEVDTGVPFSSRSGVPLLIRGGASFRL
jgi:hypothetical protein